MTNYMEDLLKKQLKWQRLTAILLILLLIVLFGAVIIGGYYLMNVMGEMMTTLGEIETFLEEATIKLGTLDVEGINQSFDEVEHLMSSLKGVAEQLSAFAEAIANLRSKLGF